MEVGEIFEYRLKRLSIKAPNAVSNSRRSYPRTKLYGLMDEFFRSNQSKHTDLHENPKGKNHAERGRAFHYYSEKVTMVIVWSHTLGFWC